MQSSCMHFTCIRDGVDHGDDDGDGAGLGDGDDVEASSHAKEER